MNYFYFVYETKKCKCSWGEKTVYDDYNADDSHDYDDTLAFKKPHIFSTFWKYSSRFGEFKSKISRASSMMCIPLQYPCFKDKSKSEK